MKVWAAVWRRGGLRGGRAVVAASLSVLLCACGRPEATDSKWAAASCPGVSGTAVTAKTLAGLSLFEEADLVIRLSHEAQARFPDIRLVLNPQRGHVVIYFKEHVSVIRQATVMCEFARDFGVSPEVLWSGGETTVQND